MKLLIEIDDLIQSVYELLPRGVRDIVFSAIGIMIGLILADLVGLI